MIPTTEESASSSVAPPISGPEFVSTRRPKSAVRRAQWVGFLVAAGLLAANIALTQPGLERIGRSDWVGPTYLMIRIAVTLFYALWLSLWLRSTQGAIFRAVTLLGFVDQVVFKFALIQVRRYLDPQSWLSDLGGVGSSPAGAQGLSAAGSLATEVAGGLAAGGSDLGAGSILVGLGMSYALFVPFLVLMTFLVSEMGEALSRRMRR